MSFLRHFAIALFYTAAAIAVALTLPMVVPDLGRWTAVALGALILLFGAFLHDSTTRSHRRMALLDALEESHAAGRHLVAELAEARAELRAIRGGLAAGSAGLAPAAAVEDTPEEAEAKRRAVPLDLTAMMREPEDLSGGEVTVAVRKAVTDNRVEVATWPIMLLPQRTPAHVECFPRIPVRDGAFIHPNRHADRVNDTGHAAEIDLRVLLRAVNLARLPGRDWRSPACFVALSPHNLRNTAFLDDMAAFLDDNREAAKRIVLEVDLDDLPVIAGSRKPAVERIVGYGVRFAISGVGKVTNVDPDLLLRAQIRFVMVEAQALLAQARNAFSGFRMAEVKGRLDRAAADLIVTDVADQETLLEVLDAGADFASGPVFGPPALA
ncbi:MAG: EAL domain-containing protein [Rhodospirillaceae bacterium]|nr:EAL domain-containing protein [Rhodospirillaceae bacterium]